ncbi:branched-chain amino acid ABC transporter permease [Deinococcus psychrotolerans]|uniref:Branched-chain amino acid ABC transporter permease n=1 Tax=Deinococcus psychrotolerans TaxID=2489213 RepID=A0A3G8YQ62_9DEIO|nr:AzlC family ABC transporter permease [Deinococcus psychrotolerans]AZI43326.1 branched-chain amino acid ABC transporter permease [Deinococcus psychrotolerans]
MKPSAASFSLSPSFWRGLRAFLPLVPGILPFSLVTGVAAVQAGFSPVQSIFFSVIGFAGSAQLIASQMFKSGTPTILILLSALVVNLRFAIYSAAMLPVLSRASKLWRWPLAYVLTDQNFAVMAARPADELNPVQYYAGASAVMWLTWQLGTVAGALLGAGIPAAWPLDFAVPLSFIALLVPVLKTRPQLLAALVSGAVAVAAHGLPYRLNLMVGAACGIAVGLYVQNLRAKSVNKDVQA